MEGTPDISRVINLIMENPELIAGIKSMLASDSGEASESATEQEREDTSTVSALPEETQIQKETETETGRSRRNALLKALKPYVSGGRAKAIDTMMSLADVMEIVRKG